MKLTTEQLLSYDAKIKRLLNPDISEINEEEIIEVFKYIVENSLPLNKSTLDVNIKSSGSTETMSAPDVGNVSMETDKIVEWKSYNPSDHIIRFGKFKYSYSALKKEKCGIINIEPFLTSVSDDATLNEYKLCFDLKSNKPLALFGWKIAVSFKIPFMRLYCTIFETTLLKGMWKYSNSSVHMTSTPY
jgi:hypothetical protein